jgi:hypothetical protein
MSRPRHARCRAAAVFAAAQLVVLSLVAQTGANVPAPNNPSVTAANLMPPKPQSPVAFFRRLLTMTARERADYLTNRPPEVRERILAKVREYVALGPDERELRLRATELRWYLMPLLREPPANRTASLAQVPDDLRDLVNSRLAQWDALPQQSRQEFLDNDKALHYFAGVQTTNAAAANPAQQKIADDFNRFFELTPEEKQKSLNTLSDAERVQMETTMQSFDKLPPPQRRDCIRAFKEFAGMNAQERAEFLKNADRWSQMSPKERQAWRDLVAQVPLWPPMPAPAVKLPMPPKIQPRPHPAVATNLN